MADRISERTRLASLKDSSPSRTTDWSSRPRMSSSIPVSRASKRLAGLRSPVTPVPSARGRPVRALGESDVEWWRSVFRPFQLPPGFPGAPCRSPFLILRSARLGRRQTGTRCEQVSRQRRFHVRDSLCRPVLLRRFRCVLRLRPGADLPPGRLCPRRVASSNRSRCCASSGARTRSGARREASASIPQVAGELLRAGGLASRPRRVRSHARGRALPVCKCPFRTVVAELQRLRLPA